MLWLHLWQVWLDLSQPFLKDSVSTPQTILVEYFKAYVVLSSKLQGKWRTNQVQEYCEVVLLALATPVPKDTSPFLVPGSTGEALTTLHYQISLGISTLYVTKQCCLATAKAEGNERTFPKPNTLEEIESMYILAHEQSVLKLLSVVMDTLIRCIEKSLELSNSIPNLSASLEVHFGPFVISLLRHAAHIILSYFTSSKTAVDSQSDFSVPFVSFLKVCRSHDNHMTYGVT